MVSPHWVLGRHPEGHSWSTSNGWRPKCQNKLDANELRLYSYCLLRLELISSHSPEKTLFNRLHPQLTPWDPYPLVKIRDDHQVRATLALASPQQLSKAPALQQMSLKIACPPLAPHFQYMWTRPEGTWSPRHQLGPLLSVSNSGFFSRAPMASEFKMLFSNPCWNFENYNRIVFL